MSDENLNPEIIDIKARAFAFAVRTVKLCRLLEKHPDVGATLCSQLFDAGTSIGVNLEEAVSGQSEADFMHKNAVSLKEAREANYWLRLILATSDFEEYTKKEITEMERESGEIAESIGESFVITKSWAR